MVLGQGQVKEANGGLSGHQRWVLTILAFTLHWFWVSSYIEHGEGIFGLLQRLSVVRGNIRFVAAKSHARAIADGEGETEGHKLPSINSLLKGEL